MNDAHSSRATFNAVSFTRFMERCALSGQIALQPRMGVASPHCMRDALKSVRQRPHATVGTLTLDSYTRVGDTDSPRRALAKKGELNGYPIVTHDHETTRLVLNGIFDQSFPVQVRHGAPHPQQIFRRLVELNIPITEGGPVSYCLPYSRTPLNEAVKSWTEGCQILADNCGDPHVESFGGCMLGQLCPPSLLIALTVLEGLFFRQRGIRSFSLSYAQGTHDGQDLGAIRALKRLSTEYFSDSHWHVVFYMYMGVFPNTRNGASQLIADAARIALVGGSHRVIVKTPSEAHEIPNVKANIEALDLARAALDTPAAHSYPSEESEFESEILREARAILERVLNLSADVGTALVAAFRDGILDVPYCLHSDNRGASRCRIDDVGALRWAKRGRIPAPERTWRAALRQEEVTSEELLQMLHYKARHYDSLATRRQ